MLPFIKEAVSSSFSKPSTENYPAADAPAPEGYRGRIVFHADRCISCGMCERVCAGGAISTTAVETEEGQLITRRFFLGSCTFCANCADFCVKNAIELTTDYHMVARDESELVVDRHLPQEEARAQEARGLRRGEPASTVKPRDDGLPVSDPAKCVYCTLCAKKCPAGALTVDRKEKIWKLDEDKCIACGTCHDVCPKKAIVM